MTAENFRRFSCTLIRMVASSLAAQATPAEQRSAKAPQINLILAGVYKR